MENRQFFSVYNTVLMTSYPVTLEPEWGTTNYSEAGIAKLKLIDIRVSA